MTSFISNDLLFVIASLRSNLNINCYLYFVKKSYVYILTNKNNTVIYIGVTSNLLKRIYQHKAKIFKGFTSKYKCNKLVYFEEFDSIYEAINREKQLKSGNR